MSVAPIPSPIPTLTSEPKELVRQLHELRRFPRGTDASALTARLEKLAEIIANPAVEAPIPETIDDDPSNSSLVYHIDVALARRSA